MSAQGTAGIGVPAGGAALAPISQAFQPNLRIGTGNLTVPIPLPVGRCNLTLSLCLTYSTGNPNGPFGLGWMLNVPQVSRRSDRRIPRYHATADTFMLPEAAEPVPIPVVSSAPEPGAAIRLSASILLTPVPVTCLQEFLPPPTQHRIHPAWRPRDGTCSPPPAPPMSGRCHSTPAPTRCSSGVSSTMSCGIISCTGRRRLAKPSGNPMTHQRRNQWPTSLAPT